MFEVLCGIINEIFHKILTSYKEYNQLVEEMKINVSSALVRKLIAHHVQYDLKVSTHFFI